MNLELRISSGMLEMKYFSLYKKFLFKMSTGVLLKSFSKKISSKNWNKNYSTFWFFRKTKAELFGHVRSEQSAVRWVESQS